MATTLNASTSVTFADLSDVRSGIKLVEDSDRPVADTVFHPPPFFVSAKASTYVRLYHGSSVDPKVQALTGSLVASGASKDVDDTELLVFTPDATTVAVQPWATNIRVMVRGAAFTAAGLPITVDATYNPVSHAVSVSKPAFAIVEVTYDAPYKLYLYKFSGSCPIAEPQKYDASGNEIIGPVVKHFTDGVIVAYDPGKSVHATLQLQQPECKWKSSGARVQGTEAKKTLPRLYMDVHPDYPPRLVASNNGEQIWCECTLRIFPANAATVLYSTSGSASLTSSVEKLDVEDVLFFDNASSATLTRTPASSVALTKQQLFVVDTLNNSFDGLGLDSVELVAPNNTVIDVEYTGRGTYINPTARKLGPDEVCAVDRFKTPTEVLAVVTASYAATYSCAVFTFEEASTSAGWKPATVVARAIDGRVAKVEVSPPSLKSRTRKFADG